MTIRLCAAAGIATALLVSPAAAQGNARGVDLGPNASLKGLRLLPDDSPWNKDISREPVDPRSQRILARIGLDTPLKADFGTEWEGAPIGIPYVVVDKDQPRVPVEFNEAPDESDPGPYPIPRDAPIEGGPDGRGDRHILVLDRDTWQLWEVFNAFRDGKGGWTAGSGALWDLRKVQVRRERWTSADAAGLPILPGLVRRDEIQAGRILHALRFTVAQTQRGYINPATHQAGATTDPNVVPMGARFRLKAGFDLSGYQGAARIILQCLKTYGMFVADNGSNWYLSGATDTGWDDTDLNQLKAVPGSAFEAVDTGPVHAG